MALQLGIQLASSQTNNYLTDAKYVRGGYLAVEDITAIDARWYDKGEGGVIVEGTLCYDIKTETFFKYTGEDWEELEFATDGDERTITLDDNQKLSLKDFGKAYYKYVAKTEESEAHYEKVTGFKAGLQPQIATENGQLVMAWYEPNPTTVEGLEAEISALSSSVQDITDVLNGAGAGEEHQPGLIEKVTTLETNSHTHENKDELDLIESGDVAKWHAKQDELVAGDFIAIAADKKTISVDFTGLILDGGTAEDWAETDSNSSENESTGE